jgi:hypothetical protein
LRPWWCCPVHRGCGDPVIQECTLAFMDFSVVPRFACSSDYRSLQIRRQGVPHGGRPHGPQWQGLVGSTSDLQSVVLEFFGWKSWAPGADCPHDGGRAAQQLFGVTSDLEPVALEVFVFAL